MPRLFTRSLLLLSMMMAAVNAMPKFDDEAGFQAAMDAVRESKRPIVAQGNPSCKITRVLLTSEDLVGKIYATGPPGPNVLQGGRITLSDPDDPTVKIGTYEFGIHFLTELGPNFDIGCITTGAYTFGQGEMVSFTAPCANSPFFSINGGTGKFQGAEGFVEFMIRVENGFIHEIYVCNKPGNRLRN